MSEYVSYEQYNWISAKLGWAEENGIQAGKDLVSSEQFEADFPVKMGMFLDTWPDEQLEAFSLGEISSIYVKPLLLQLYDADPKVLPEAEAKDFAEQGLEGEKSEIDMSLQDQFQSGLWTFLLDWAKPRVQEECRLRLDTTVEASFESAWADLTKGFAGECTDFEMSEIMSHFDKAHALGERAVVQGLVETAVADYIADFLGNLPEDALQTIKQGDGEDPGQDLLEGMYTKFFATVPALPVNPPGCLESARFQKLWEMAYREGAMGKMWVEVYPELPGYAQSI